MRPGSARHGSTSRKAKFPGMGPSSGSSQLTGLQWRWRLQRLRQAGRQRARLRRRAHAPRGRRTRRGWRRPGATPHAYRHSALRCIGKALNRECFVCRESTSHRAYTAPDPKPNSNPHQVGGERGGTARQTRVPRARAAERRRWRDIRRRRVGWWRLVRWRCGPEPEARFAARGRCSLARGRGSGRF